MRSDTLLYNKINQNIQTCAFEAIQLIDNALQKISNMPTLRNSLNQIQEDHKLLLENSPDLGKIIGKISSRLKTYFDLNEYDN